MFSPETSAFTAMMTTDGREIGFEHADGEMPEVGIVVRPVP